MKGHEVFRSYLAEGQDWSSSGPSWPPSPEQVQLREDEVHLWKAHQRNLVPSLRDLGETLSDDERERASRFHFDEHRNGFILRRGLLRTILGLYLHAEPGEVKFDYDSFGKPHVGTEVAISFNLSHSAGVMLYGVTGGESVGVDVERIAYGPEKADIAKSYFSSLEVASLFSLSPSLQGEAFFNCWTRKEAYIKARGQGLSIPLDSFSVSLVPGEAASLLASEEGEKELSGWSLLDLPIRQGYAAALAVKRSGWKLRCWEWSASGQELVSDK